VLGFYSEGLVSRQPRQAFLRFMAPDFVEHKPDIPKGTRDETARFLAQIIAELPEARWEIVRTIAEKDMVFLHARFTPASGSALLRPGRHLPREELQDSRALGRCWSSA